MADREGILDKYSEHIYDFGLALGMDNARKALDEYMRETVLEAFEFVARETTGHSITKKEGKETALEFKYKGEWITKEQLFENFL